MIKKLISLFSRERINQYTSIGKVLYLVLSVTFSIVAIPLICMLDSILAILLVCGTKRVKFEIAIFYCRFENFQKARRITLSLLNRYEDFYFSILLLGVIEYNLCNLELADNLFNKFVEMQYPDRIGDKALLNWIYNDVINYYSSLSSKYQLRPFEGDNREK